MDKLRNLKTTDFIYIDTPFSIIIMIGKWKVKEWLNGKKVIFLLLFSWTLLPKKVCLEVLTTLRCVFKKLSITLRMLLPQTPWCTTGMEKTSLSLKLNNDFWFLSYSLVKDHLQSKVTYNDDSSEGLFRNYEQKKIACFYQVCLLN